MTREDSPANRPKRRPGISERLGRSKETFQGERQLLEHILKLSKALMKSASERRKLSNLISKGFVITVLKCLVTTRRQEESGLETASPGPESSQLRRTGTRELSSAPLRHLCWETNTRFSDCGRDSRPVCCEAWTQRIRIREACRSENRGRRCSSSASHLPLKIERPSEVG